MRRHSCLILVLLVLACGQPVASPSPVDQSRTASARGKGTANSGTRAPTSPPQPAATVPPRPLASGLRTELVADGLQLPVNLAFAPDGRLFLTEVSRGTVRVIEHGQLLPTP